MNVWDDMKNNNFFACIEAIYAQHKIYLYYRAKRFDA